MVNRRTLSAILRFVLSIVLLALLFSQINFNDFIEHIRTMNASYYLIGLACYFGFIALWSVRWLFIIRAAGETAKFLRVFTTTLVGNFFAMFLPEAIGSDLARMYGLKDDVGTSANIVSTVLLDRVIGLISLVLMAMVALVIGSEFVSDQSVVLLIVGLLVFFVVGWFLFFNRRFMEWNFRWLFRLPVVNRMEDSIRALYESLYSLNRQPRLLLLTLLMSLLVQGVEVISVIFIAQAIGVQTSLSYFFIFLPIVWLVTTIPISISGLGVREGAFAFFFSQVGVASSDAVAMSLLYYSFRVITGIFGGLIFLRSSVLDYRRKLTSQNA
jgi:glycosyltransferase 2 family protein